MSRLLAFDFADDARVHDIKDEFMFGPAFLVCPVTRPMYYDKGSVALQGVEKARAVYLPKGADWVDFWSGKKYRGAGMSRRMRQSTRFPCSCARVPSFRWGRLCSIRESCREKNLPSWSIPEGMPFSPCMRTKATITVTNRGVSRPSGWNGTIAGVYCPSGRAKVRFPVWRSPASSAWSWAAVRTRCSVKGRAWKSVTTGRPRNAVCEVNGIVENNSCKGNTV